jgi:hypothetical protein
VARVGVYRGRAFAARRGRWLNNSVCGVAGACFFGDSKPDNFPALKLGALLLGRLGALLDGGLQLSESEDDSDVVEGELWSWPGTPLANTQGAI